MSGLSVLFGCGCEGAKDGGDEKNTPEIVSLACEADDTKAGKTGGSEPKGDTAPATEITPESLKGLALERDECAQRALRTGQPCSMKEVAEVITDFAAKKSGGDASLSTRDGVKTAMKVLHCSSESCILADPEFANYAKSILGERKLAENILRFKPEGPLDPQRLSNFNIDQVLGQWTKDFPTFRPYPFAMIDFDKTHHVLASAPETIAADYAKGKRTFACALNTDVSTGSGKHWVAIFIDLRGPVWTIEYFNSAGNPPARPVIDWMARMRASLTELARGKSIRVESLTVTSVAHQKNDTECGAYVLFYIRRRLEGTLYTFFQGKGIPDDDMVAFRAYVFRPPPEKTH